MAMGLTYHGFYEFPFKKFYWATSATYQFAPLPQPNDQHKKFIDECDLLFWGEPEKILVEVKPPENAGQPESNPEPEAGAPKAEEKKQPLEELNGLWMGSWN